MFFLVILSQSPAELGMLPDMGVSVPLFFFCFQFSKVIKIISQMDMACSINDFRCKIIGYADGLVLLAPSSGVLQCWMREG